MKKTLMVLMAVTLFSALPVIAAEHGDMKMDMHEGMTMDASECARRCALQAESIQEKIARIQGEIKKGSTKYNADELKKLEGKLKEANEILERLQHR